MSRMAQRIKLEIESKYGFITWKTQMGYGEGLIVCSVQTDNGIVEGSSQGDCTELEALINLWAELEFGLTADDFVSEDFH